MPQPIATAKSKRQVVGLDILRFVAAMLVVVYHLMFWGWTPGPAYTQPFPALYRPYTPLTQFGWIGVEFFFVLSGFVIAYSAEGNTPRRFLEHRWLRLFPGTLICATITALVLSAFHLPFSHTRMFWTWMRSIFFYPAGPYVDDSYWSLTVEVGFYTYIFLMLALRRSRFIPALMATLGIISTAFWIVATQPRLWPATHFSAGILTSATVEHIANVSLLFYGCYFTLGVFLYLVLLKGVTAARILTLAICTLGGILQITHHAAWVSEHTQHPFTSTGAILIWLTMTALIIASVLLNDRITDRLSPHAARLLRRLGLMTYPLYLLHSAMGMRCMMFLRPHMPEPAVFLCVFLPILTLAYITSAYLEPRLQTYLRKGLTQLHTNKPLTS